MDYVKFPEAFPRLRVRKVWGARVGGEEGI